MKPRTYITFLAFLVLCPFFSGATLAQDPDSGIKLWDVATGRQLSAVFKGQGDVTAMALSPDGRMIAAADDHKSINIWDLATRKLVGKLVGHTQFIKEVGFLANGSMLGSLDASGNFRLWDTVSLRLVRSLSEIGAFASSPDGKTMATSDGSIVKLWDLEKWAVVRQSVVLRRSNGKLVETSFFENGAGATRFINASASNLDLGMVSSGRGICLVSYLGVSVAFSRDGKVVWASDDCMSEIYLWNLTTDKYSRLNGDSMSTFDDGLTIADNTIDLRDAAGRKLRSFTGHVGEINTVQLSPNRKVMASGGSDGYIKLWDVETGNMVREFLSRQELVTEVAFSPDGKTLISGGVADRTQKPTLYILSVGISHYCRGEGAECTPGRHKYFWDIHTEDDIRDFNSLLNKMGSNQYSRVDSKILFDKEATGSAIVAAFREIIAKSKPQDTFVFQYSGHGSRFPSPKPNDPSAMEWSMIPYDYVSSEDDSKNLPSALIQSLISQMQAQHQFIILDANSSSAGMNDLVAQLQKENKEFEGLIKRDVWILGTAAGGLEFEFRDPDSEKWYGRMTYSLIKGLSGSADANADGSITVRELFNYSQSFAAAYARDPQQEMWYAGEDFVLARTKPDGGGIGLPRTRSPQTESFYPASFTYSPSRVFGYDSKPAVGKEMPTPTPDAGKMRAEIAGASTQKQSNYERNGKDYALIIATDKYDSPGWPTLANPVQDATDIAAELTDYYGFQIDPQTDILKNPKRADVYAALRRIKARQYQPDDQLFIFIAGHGYYSEGLSEGFLIFSDGAPLDRTDELCASCGTYLSHTMLRKVLDGLSAKHIFVVIDACFGGTFEDKRRGPADPMYENATNMKMIGRIMQFKTRKFFTSGGKEYVPDGRPGHHSPFASKFLDALRSYGGSFGLLTLSGIKVFTERTDEPMPRYGEWGENESGSDFIFELKKKP